MEIPTRLRNAELQDLVSLLQQQRDVRYDAVVNAAALHSHGGLIVIDGGAAVITDDGVESRQALLAPTDVFDDGVSARLGIPRDYLRRLRAREDVGYLLDANINGWLRDEPERTFLVRGFRNDDPNDVGIARALLSDRFALGMDNLDVLLAALDGVRRSGVDVEVKSGDLTERRMRLRLVAPEITAVAPVWLGRYRTPFGDGGRGEPIVYAGLEVRNSETGGGAFVLVPVITVQVCSNGLTVTRDAFRHVHLGSKLEEGVITWSADTVHANLELVTNQARDAVTSFLNADYLIRKVAEIEERSAAPIEGEIIPTIERVANQFKFTQTERDTILKYFIKSGDVTAGGVMQAVTATAQTVEDPDRAAELEDVALDVLAFAAR